MGGDVVPFRIEVPEADIEDLRDRLRRTRWPEAETVADWTQGTPLAYARELCRYWRDEYDWAKAQARLNRFPQYRTTVDGLDIHFVHVRSRHDNALPLIMTHGWPGSTVEFDKVIEQLTDPVASGGTPSDAFHVVCPTLPGFGFSGKPTQPGWGTQRIADAWDQLMARLGYSRYGAQGGDWGSQVTTALSVQHPEHLVGIHLNMVFAFPEPGTAGELTEREREALAALDYHRKWGSGYAIEQSTRPQSLGYGLVDSPAGLCGWIVEKYWAWSDCNDDPANVFTRDQMLDNIMLYWLPSTAASSARLYWESFGKRIQEPVLVPAGASIFPKEIYRPSRRWVEQQFRDLRYWNELDNGGHFAAMEQPATFVDEVRAAFRLFR